MQNKPAKTRLYSGFLLLCDNKYGLYKKGASTKANAPKNAQLLAATQFSLIRITAYETEGAFLPKDKKIHL